jgi:hypothetical protein
MDKNTETKTAPICAYCNKPIPDGDLEMRRIYSPNWRSQGGQSPPRPYHKSKRCGGYDQMAHEG